MKRPTKHPTKPTAKRAWRLVCLLGNGQVSGSCGHAHPTLVRAMQCSYGPAAQQRNPAAELRARPVEVTRPR